MISREKYDKAREVIFQWESKCNSLREENRALRETMNTLPDNEEVDELKLQVKDCQKTIKQLKIQLSEQKNMYKDKINSLMMDKVLLEGKLQQMDEAKKELQERYKELKQDYRDIVKERKG